LFSILVVQIFLRGMVWGPRYFVRGVRVDEAGARGPAWM